MPVDVVADLSLASGCCALVGELAALVGCTCMPSTRMSTSLCDDFQVLGDKVAVVFHDFPALFGGGRITRRPSEQLDRDLEAMIAAAMNLRAALRALPEQAAVSSLPCVRG